MHKPILSQENILSTGQEHATILHATLHRIFQSKMLREPEVWWRYILKGNILLLTKNQKRSNNLRGTNIKTGASEVRTTGIYRHGSVGVP